MGGFRVSKLISFNIFDHLRHRHQSVSPLIFRLLSSSSYDTASTDGFDGQSPPLRRRSSGGPSDRSGENYRRDNWGRGHGGGRRDFEYSGNNTNRKSYYEDNNRSRMNNRVSSEVNKASRRRPGTWSSIGVSSEANEADSPKSEGNSSYFPFDDDEQKPSFSRNLQVNNNKTRDDDAFLEKFKLGIDKDKEGNKPNWNESDSIRCGGEGEAVPEQPLPPPEDADEIFRKMKETGLIPNAVAMLHGLCTDGLVQEAMKLFGLMRERGTIPEVVVYTAVVEGFCKAQKLEDAKRIFRKMQKNGVVANAFSYGVLVQGLCKGRMLDDALEYCLEMLEAGHSPNLATFIGLVDGFCRERSLEAAQVMISNLREKGYCFDEKAVREFLDKKGPFLPLVWEAILGRKSSQHF